MKIIIRANSLVTSVLLRKVGHLTPTEQGKWPVLFRSSPCSTERAVAALFRGAPMGQEAGRVALGRRVSSLRRRIRCAQAHEPPPLPWLRSVLGADSAPFQKHGRAIPSTFLGSPVAQSHKLPPLPAEKIEENGQ